MSAPVLALRGAGVTFGGRPTFVDLEIFIAPGEKACLVGRNGCGKSTLMKLLAGWIAPDAGERFLQPGKRVAYLPQDPPFAEGETVGGFIARGLLPPGAADDHRALKAAAHWEVDPEARMETLSGGQRRRAALAQAMVDDPDVLLLDEPTNHLDLPTIAAVEQEIARGRAAVLTVSHDRAFLKAVSRRMYWLDRGALRTTQRGFAAFDDWADEVAEAEAAESRRLNIEIKAEERYMERGVTARRRRNQRRVERLDALRLQRLERQKPGGKAAVSAVSADPSGRLVAELEHIHKSYGARRIVTDFSTRILRGDRLGLVGANGAGKTTLLNILLGEEKADTGRVRHGVNLEIARFDQTKDQLEPDMTPWCFLAGDQADHVDVGGRRQHVMGYLRKFLFEERQARQPIAQLSGGERSRLLLAKILARPSNLLALDEPTNDLDMDTLDLLEDMLADYPGTLILVSHDRDFLDRLVGSVIAVEGDGDVREHVGGFTEYAREAGARAVGATTKAAKKAEPKAAPKPQTKLSYKENRDLERLPDQIAALEAEIAGLETALADPGLYTRDPAAFTQRSERLTAAQKEKDLAETRWLQLEEKREAFAG